MRVSQTLLPPGPAASLQMDKHLCPGGFTGPASHFGLLRSLRCEITLNSTLPLWPFVPHMKNQFDRI